MQSEGLNLKLYADTAKGQDKAMRQISEKETAEEHHLVFIPDSALPLWMWGVKEKDMALSGFPLYINSFRRLYRINEQTK